MGKKKAMIIMSALLIMTIAAFLVAFIKYRPVQEDGLIAIKGQISKLEYYVHKIHVILLKRSQIHLYFSG